MMHVVYASAAYTIINLDPTMHTLCFVVFGMLHCDRGLTDSSSHCCAVAVSHLSSGHGTVIHAPLQEYPCRTPKNIAGGVPSSARQHGTPNTMLVHYTCCEVL